VYCVLLCTDTLLESTIGLILETARLIVWIRLNWLRQSPVAGCPAERLINS